MDSQIFHMAYGDGSIIAFIFILAILVWAIWKGAGYITMFLYRRRMDRHNKLEAATIIRPIRPE